METSAARRHERLSHGFPVATTAAAPARYVTDGKRASAIHVPPVTAPSTRPERSNQASASTAAAAPAIAARTTTPRRRNRRSYSSSTITRTGIASASSCVIASRSSRDCPGDVARGCAEIAADPGARRGRDFHEEGERDGGHDPDHQADDVAGVAEIALAGGLVVDDRAHVSLRFRRDNCGPVRHDVPPGHRGAPSPHSDRPVRSRTSPTSDRRGWNASAESAAKRSALFGASKENRYLTQPPGNW